MDNLRNTYGSSMAEHLINNRDCAEKFSVDFFSVLSKLHSSSEIIEDYPADRFSVNRGNLC